MNKHDIMMNNNTNALTRPVSKFRFVQRVNSDGCENLSKALIETYLGAVE
jgi:hypothetical protein